MSLYTVKSLPNRGVVQTEARLARGRERCVLLQAFAGQRAVVASADEACVFGRRIWGATRVGLGRDATRVRSESERRGTWPTMLVSVSEPAARANLESWSCDMARTTCMPRTRLKHAADAGSARDDRSAQAEDSSDKGSRARGAIEEMALVVLCLNARSA